MKTKPNTKVKTYIQIWHNIVTDLVLLVKLNGETQQWIVSMNELCYLLIISIFNFQDNFIHFTSQITLKPSPTKKLKLIFKFGTI